jgi:hypothetical protein
MLKDIVAALTYFILTSPLAARFQNLLLLYGKHLPQFKEGKECPFLYQFLVRNA